VPAITIVFGILLIGVGVGGYFQSASHAPTALIPAGMGLVFILLGLLAFKEGLRKHAMHLASVLALLGVIIPGYRGLPGLYTILTGGTLPPDARPLAIYANSLTAGLCLVLLILCINSFVQARLRRKKPAA
jgi:hypothetical protein